jgi:hypothetical protein
MRKSPSLQKNTPKFVHIYSWFIEPNIRRTIRKLEILYIFSDRHGKLLLYIVWLSKMLRLKLIEYLVLKLLILYSFACAYQVDGWICSNKYLNNFLNSVKPCTIISSDQHAQCYSSRNYNRQHIFGNKHAHTHFRYRFRRPLVRIAWFHLAKRSIAPLYVRPPVLGEITYNHVFYRLQVR